MKLREFRDVLLTVHDKVYHFESSKESEYIVWHEVGNLTLRGDDVVAESGARIAVDFFTKDEYSEIPDKLANALTGCDEIYVSDFNVDYEKNTEYIHYAYTCEVI